MKNKYLKPVALGLLASNVLAFGGHTVAFAETNKAVSKEQTQKADALKKVKTPLVSFAATDGTSELSELQKIMNEVIKEDNGITDMFLQRTKEKAEQKGIEFDYLEFIKGVLNEGIMFTGEATEVPVLSFLNPIIDVFFPKNEKDVWDQIKPKVEELINEKLDERFTEETLNTLVLKLKGLTKNVETLKENINVLNGKGEHPDNAMIGEALVQTDKEKEQGDVRASVKDVVANINAMSEEFKNGKYAVASLPLYTQLANIHIGLLKDLAEHGEDWGYTEKQQDQNKADLQKAIKTYTNTVYETFNEGLNKMKEKQGMSNGWDEVNRYVRTMTLTSLDFASQWSIMDVTLYPQATHLDKTRQIYSDIYKDTIGHTDYDKKTGDQYYDKLLGIYSKKYPGELKNLTINKFGQDAWTNNHINGIDQEYEGSSYDYWDSQWDTKGIKSKQGTRGESLGSASFSADKPLTKKNFPDMVKRISNPDQIPAGHKVSQIISGFRDGIWDNQPFICNDVTAYVPEETRADTKVDGSQIVGIAADKVSTSQKFESVLEYVNGGNARKSSESGGTLQFEVNSTKKQQFKVRYRVASNTGTSVDLSLKAGAVNDTGKSYASKGNTSIPNTEALKDNPKKGVTGLQGTYILVEGPTVTLQPGANALEITNTGGKELVVDRIELAPVISKAGNPGWDKEHQHYYGKSGDGTKLAEGEMATDWQSIDNQYYYFGDDGTVKTSWQLIRNKYYYLNKDGTMQTGWYSPSEKETYYLGKKDDNTGLKEGEMATGWMNINNSEYYFGKKDDNTGLKEGQMATGKIKIGNKDYDFGKNGEMQKDQPGWKDDQKYYVDENGNRVTGLKTIDNFEYYFGTGDDGTNLQRGEKAVGWQKFKDGHYEYGVCVAMEQNHATSISGH
ncbi:hypothetical protein BK708_14220 [Bacillus thuringiensis serovar yunnanensis]|nr:hypothetical protein BK708_14220 [Bacillus thuringiensis serovar yunnanensis]